MSDADLPESEGLLGEVEALRAENARLRSLLGLDEPARRNGIEPWEPSDGRETHDLKNLVDS
jgi:hypothetical protein